MSCKNRVREGLVAPHPEEKHAVSCVIGNSRIYWGMHSGPEFKPVIFWRTPLVDINTVKDEEPCTVLGNYFALEAMKTLFDPVPTENNDDPSDSVLPDYEQETMLGLRSALRIPFLTVYIVSTNPGQEQGVEYMFQDVPCQLVRLKATDFVHSDFGVYPGMGVDRVAGVRGAIANVGVPALVIDGGTAMTYTAVDPDGHIVGGGICPGIKMKLEALNKMTGALPWIQSEEVDELIAECKEKQEGLSRYGTDTHRAILGSVLHETYSHVEGIIKDWLVRMKPRVAEAKANVDKGRIPMANTDLKVCITGGDAKLMDDLLKENHSYILEADDGWEPLSAEIAHEKHLIHTGIGQVLSDAAKAKASSGDDGNDDEETRNVLLGQRVAAKAKKGTGEKATIRGTIVAVERGSTLDEDEYRVFFDAGETRMLDILRVYDYLRSYAQKGEGSEHAELSKAYEKKQEQAREAAALLLEESKQVWKQSPKRNKAKTKTRPAPDEDSAAKKKPRIMEKVSGDVLPSKMALTPEQQVGKGATADRPSTAEKRTFAPVTTEEKKDEQEEEASPEPLVATQPQEEEPGAEESPQQEGRQVLEPAAVAAAARSGASPFVNRRVAKFFGKDLYFGTIAHYIAPENNELNVDLWHVVYDDSDKEDYDRDEVEAALDLYKLHDHKDVET